MEQITTVLVGGGLHGELFEESHLIAEKDTVDLSSQRKQLWLEAVSSYARAGDREPEVVATFKASNARPTIDTYGFRTCRYPFRIPDVNHQYEVVIIVLAAKSLDDAQLQDAIESAITKAGIDSGRRVTLRSDCTLRVEPAETSDAAGERTKGISMELIDSSDYKNHGIMPPSIRQTHLRRMLKELQTPDDLVGLDGVPPWKIEMLRKDAAQDLCFRLYCEDVSNQIAADLGVTQQQVREALDRAIRWSPQGMQPILPAAGG